MWVWSKLSSPIWEDAWQERLQGEEALVMTRFNDGKSLRVEVYAQEKEPLLSLQKDFGGRLRKLVHKNWAALTQPELAPLKIRDKLIICATRQDAVIKAMADQYPERGIVQIPPDRAFGTGNHATTASCLRFLCDGARSKKNWSMLDMGCGTGILALCGRVLGADKVVGVDFDEQAISVAQGNGVKNSMEEVRFVEGDATHWNEGEHYDVIAANLFAGILEKSLPNLVGQLAQGGCLIVSGILREQWECVEKAAREQGVVFDELKVKGKWVTAQGHHAGC